MARLPAIVALGIVVVSCAAHDDTETAASTQQAIVGGSPSDDSQNDTVMLFVLDPSGPKRLGICTAALVAPRLLLTARHCIAKADATVACNADGTPLIDAKVYGDRDATNLYVFTGKDRPQLIGASAPALDPTNWKPAGQGLAIIDDGADTLCDHDIALVLLKDPIEGMPIAPLRLDGEIRAGEKLLTVGWGVTRDELEPQKRQQRGGVNVRRVGPSEDVPVLTKSEFLFGESICLGDSGGPIFAADTKAIVGVVSRGGNDVDPSEGLAATCEDADNLGTKLAPFKSLIMSAFERAGAEPKLEEKPDDSSCCVSAAVSGRSGTGRGAMGLFGLGLVAAAVRRRRGFRTPSAQT